MATQITRRNWRAALSANGPSININPRYALIAGAVCIALVYLATFISMRDARSDRDIAERRYLDASQLLTVPPVPIATLEANLHTAKDALAMAQADATISSIDPASDEATALLVERAQDAGLTVVAVARLNESQREVKDVTYNVASLRMTLHAASRQELVGFLQQLQASDPALVPSLTSLTVDDHGANAEIVFSLYAEVQPTPVAGTQATP